MSLNLKDVGGNAFPVDENTRGDGMTLLDFFAAQVVASLVRYDSEGELSCYLEYLARDAYDVAEEMVKEKRRRQG